jgi:hypothetical protein
MKRILVAALLILIALGLSACRQNFSWNQKLTVTVETPQGERSGSAVVYERVTYGQQFMSGSLVQYDIKGEATVVEVAPGKYLFALLGEASTKELATRVWWESFTEEQKRDPGKAYRIIESAREAREVPPKEYPLLVTFTDINDPKCVKMVDPANLATSFGSGYNLKSITLEITDEEVTEGKVESVLEWLSSLKGALVPTEIKPANQYKPEEELSSFHFVRKG